MHPTLFSVLRCPFCGSSLGPPQGVADEQPGEGTVPCTGCSHRFPLSAGVLVLGDPAQLRSLQDHWPPEALTQARLLSNIDQRRQWYLTNPGFQELIDLAAGVKGLIVDVGTGPGSSFAGALVPRLDRDQHLVMSDVAIDVLHRLKRCWDSLPHDAPLDFIAFDMHRMPLATGSVEAFVSSGGFENANADPERRSPVGGAGPYLEAGRALKAGGWIFEHCRVFDADSETARHLARWGYPNASGESLEAFWASAGLRIEGRWTVAHWRGKADPEDSLPVGDEDRWQEVLWALRKM
jgi:hypothetical protein